MKEGYIPWEASTTEPPPRVSSNGSLADLLPPTETEIESSYDGSWKPGHADARSAAREVVRRRREAEEKDTSYADVLGKDLGPIDALHYEPRRDELGRIHEPPERVIAHQAAKDLAAYRQDKAALLLKGIAAEQQTAEQQAAEAQQAEQVVAQEQQQQSQASERLAQGLASIERARQEYEWSSMALVAQSLGANLQELWAKVGDGIRR